MSKTDFDSKLISFSRKVTSNKTTIVNKIFGRKWRKPVKMDRKRKICYLLLRVFNSYFESFIS